MRFHYGSEDTKLRMKLQFVDFEDKYEENEEMVFE